MRLSDRIAGFLFRHQLRGASRAHGLLCGGGRIEIRTKHGVRLLLDPAEYVDGMILRHGFYEEEVLQALLGRLRPGDVFWDIGANLGVHALTVRRLRPDTTVVAFEPNPQMAGLIREAASMNGLAVTVVESALDAAAGSVDFFVHAGNVGRSSLMNHESDPKLQRLTVHAVRGDEVDGESPTIVKIDVEGCELRVLQGMEGLMQADRIHTIVFEDAKAGSTPVKELLRKQRFEIELLPRLEGTHHALDNFLAVRAA